MRCRPESAPRSPAWIGKSAVVQRALKILHDQETLSFNEDQFADLFGITARHLRRLFKEEIGKTPKQLFFENRLNLSRKLIVETSLPIAEIALASGFNSIRRFNDAFKDRFHKRPRDIRRSPLSQTRGLEISLAYRPPFDFKGLLDFYRSHQIGHLEWFEENKMHRVIALQDEVGQIAISDDPTHSRLRVEIDFPDARMIPPILSRVRAAFDLDSDPLIIANALEQDPRMRPLLQRHPGIRLPSGWDPFEICIATILGQLVSISFGRTLVADLIDLLGADSGIKKGNQPIKLFPTAERIAKADLSSLKTTSQRKTALKSFAKAVASGKISLEPTQDVDQFVENVLAIPGLGPWTANYMALKALRHTDAFPETDLILARALEIHDKKILAQMSPWRGYAASLLWREYSQTLSKAKQKRKKS
jgi:AraC family transcriptional regulator of adaptative response / DNA-3-methyladenine glycosylase II